MRAQAGLGKPLMLVDGRGYIWGDWVITKIDETGSEFWSDGAPRMIRFALDLTEYGDDAGSGGIGSRRCCAFNSGEADMKYRTKDGDVLDAICHKHYGDRPHRVEDVLAANPGLAVQGPVLPAGLIIDLPEPDKRTAQPVIRLWS